jgi:F420-0:gamma-glutamyl ligase
MYLSAKMAHQPRGLTDHEELELLLESFSKQVEEIVSELDTLTVRYEPLALQSDGDTETALVPQTNMSTTQEVAELILDSNRNALIAMDLRVSIATLGIGVGALASGVFGMNVGASSLCPLPRRLTKHLFTVVDIAHRVASVSILLCDRDSRGCRFGHYRSRIASA